jgi:peroxiredoxin Q/BCP
MKVLLETAIALAGLSLMIGGILAQELKVGAKAPDIQATDDQGKSWKLADRLGKKVVVVYFYPADFTGGCTKQACSYRDNFQKLADMGVEVVGISGDSAKTHSLFKQEHKLPFTLLADESGAIAKSFGVPVKAGGTVKVKVAGQELTITRGATASRWTFVIDKQGQIAYRNDKVNAAEDSKAILEVIEKLK